MPKPKHPPAIASLALTPQREMSAALMLQMVHALEKTISQTITMPHKAGEILYYCHQSDTYKNVPFTENQTHKTYELPQNAQIQIHVFEIGDWWEQIHLCHELYCRPQLPPSFWEIKNTNLTSIHVEWQDISPSFQFFIQNHAIKILSLHWCTSAQDISFQSHSIEKLECFGCDFLNITQSSLPHLIQLTIGACGVQDTDVLNFPIFSQLQKLSLYDNPITDLSLSYISQIPSLQVLDLSLTSVKGNNSVYIKQLSSLKHLKLHGSQATTQFLDMLLYIETLVEIDVSNTVITREEGILFLEQRKKLSLPDVKFVF